MSVGLVSTAPMWVALLVLLLANMCAASIVRDQLIEVDQPGPVDHVERFIRLMQWDDSNSKHLRETKEQHKEHVATARSLMEDCKRCIEDNKKGWKGHPPWSYCIAKVKDKVIGPCRTWNDHGTQCDLEEELVHPQLRQSYKTENEYENVQRHIHNRFKARLLFMWKKYLETQVSQQHSMKEKRSMFGAMTSSVAHAAGQTVENLYHARLPNWVNEDPEKVPCMNGLQAAQTFIGQAVSKGINIATGHSHDTVCNKILRLVNEDQCTIFYDAVAYSTDVQFDKLGSLALLGKPDLVVR